MANSIGRWETANIRSSLRSLLGIVLTIACIGQTACATALGEGGAAFNAGNYDEATAKWTEAARAGDANAQYNLGVMWENGLGSMPKDADQAMEWYLKAARRGHLVAMVALARNQLAAGHREAAVSWLNIAARWNDADAISMLTQLNLQVPSPDLFVAKQQADAQMGYALGCALAGGCPSSQAALGTNVPPVQAYSRPQPLQREWFAATTDKMCAYADGTVLNVGSRSCPSSIGGRQ